MLSFVNDIEKAKLSAIDGLILHKIIAPYVIAVIRSQPNTAVVIEPYPLLFDLFLGQLKAFFPPDSLNPFVIDDSARIVHHGGNHPIPDPAIACNQLDHLCPDIIFIGQSNNLIPVGSSIDMQNPTSPSLCDVVFFHGVLDGCLLLDRA